MPRHALAWDLAGIPVVVVGGILLHFCFAWGGSRPVLAVFCPINESVWEHLKMAYWPVVLLTGVQLAVTEASPTLLAARAIGFYAMCVVILGLYFLTAALLPHASHAHPAGSGRSDLRARGGGRSGGVVVRDCDEQWP